MVAATAAVAASYVTWVLRMRAMRRYGQASSGLVEDVLVVAAAEMVVEAAR